MPTVGSGFFGAELPVASSGIENQDGAVFAADLVWLLSGRSADVSHLVAILNANPWDDTSVQVALREIG